MILRLEVLEPGVPAPRWRRALASFVDYLLFSVLWAPIAAVIGTRAPWLRWTVVAVIAFLAVYFATSRFIATTPGHRVLGMEPSPRGWLVDPDLHAREAWWTMLVGTVLAFDGARNLAAWPFGFTPPPFFGAGALLATLAQAALGALSLAAGLAVLHTRAWGAILAIGVIGVGTVATEWDRRALVEWLGTLAIERRASQGLPLRAGEVEAMQAALPFMEVASLLLVATLVAMAFRFASPRRRS
jgi:hypothetical protein